MRHERVRDHDGRGRVGEGDAGGRPAGAPISPVRPSAVTQGDAGDHRRQHQRHGDQRARSSVRPRNSTRASSQASGVPEQQAGHDRGHATRGAVSRSASRTAVRAELVEKLAPGGVERPARRAGRRGAARRGAAGRTSDQRRARPSALAAGRSRLPEAGVVEDLLARSAGHEVDELLRRGRRRRTASAARSGTT